VLVEVRRGRDGARQSRSLWLRKSRGELLAVGMVAAEDRAGGLGGCWRPVGGRSVRHSADFAALWKLVERAEGGVLRGPDH
jgi:hypothetical protein